MRLSQTSPLRSHRWRNFCITPSACLCKNKQTNNKTLPWEDRSLQTRIKYVLWFPTDLRQWSLGFIHLRDAVWAHFAQTGTEVQAGFDPFLPLPPVAEPHADHLLLQVEAFGDASYFLRRRLAFLHKAVLQRLLGSKAAEAKTPWTRCTCTLVHCPTTTPRCTWWSFAASSSARSCLFCRCTRLQEGDKDSRSLKVPCRFAGSNDTTEWSHKSWAERATANSI